MATLKHGRIELARHQRSLREAWQASISISSFTPRKQLPLDGVAFSLQHVGLVNCIFTEPRRLQLAVGLREAQL